MITSEIVRKVHGAFSIHGESLIGGRTYQEDAFLWEHCYDYDGGYVVAAIADGLGGARGGSDTIARAAVDIACRFGRDTGTQFMPAHLIAQTRTTMSVLADYSADDVFAMFDQDQRDHHRQLPDTTLALITADADNHELYFAWIGDSRIYALLADNRLIQLTTDHNLAAFGAPHCLTRSLGALEKSPESGHWLPGMEADWWPRRILLCTDGIHEAIPENAIRCALMNAPSPRRAALWLTRWAVRAAGATADNATALVITFNEEQKP